MDSSGKQQSNPSIDINIEIIEMSSSREGSLNKSTTRSQQPNTRKIRRFQFTDLSLSYSVRKRLYEMLISFDDNVNYEFEKQEIKKALEEILQESQSQVAYVVNNVFRYDVDNDGAITYEQFANFCLEQHFGEMAIQRLHKTSLYLRGKQRIMSASEFIKTITYCLSFIQIIPNKKVLEVCFNETDLDKDGYISYSDYFMFLKQYFGSQSQSVSAVTVTSVEQNLKKTYSGLDKKAIKDQIFKQKIEKHKHHSEQQPKPKVFLQPPITKMQVKVKKSQKVIDLATRIARLIYHQLKLSAMDQDCEHLLCSNEQISKEVLTKIIKISETRAKIIIHQAFQNNSTISYEHLLKFVIEKYMCEDFTQKISMHHAVNKERFISQILICLSFVRVKPFQFLLDEIFEEFSNGKKQLDRNQFKELITIIFSMYKWPRKTGEERNKLAPYISIYH